MNKFVTIGYKKDGKAEVIHSPNVPCQRQRALFREFKGDFVLVELWSSNSGKIKQRRLKPEAKPSKAKAEIPQSKTLEKVENNEQ